GLAFPGALALVLVLLGVHVVTGGRVFSEPWVTRGLVAAFAVGAIVCAFVRDRRAVEPMGAAPLIAVAVAIVAAVVLWGFPTLRLLPLDHAWDSDFHAGLANELINGETLPHGTVTGSIPNDYPWMYHAVLATTASFMPGGRAQDAFDSAFFLQVLGGVLTLFALGWELTRRWYGAAASALFGGLSGGFGYLVHKGVAVIIDPRAKGGAAAVRRWGDMLFVRSYNMSFNNLAPTFPRDIGFALLPAFLLLTITGFRRRSLLAFAGAGAVLGMIGLSTGESMFAGLGTAGLIVLLPPITRARKRQPVEPPVSDQADRAGHSRWAIGAALLIPSLGLWSLWLGPLMYNYFTLGGITGSANSPVILPAAAFLGAWGVAVIFAIAGLIVWLPVLRRDVGARVVLSMMVVVAALLALTHVVPLLLSKGFSTLGREHRYWPLMYLPVALLAAVGATRTVDWMLERSRTIAIVLAAVVIALCVPSPLLASAALPRAKHDPQEVTSALTGKRSMLSLMSPAPGKRCVAATTPDWSHQVFAFSGYRLILYRWTKKVWANSAHIRFIGIYDRIPTTKQRVAALNVLLAPRGRARWEAVARHWKVNVVTIPQATVPAWLSKNYRVEKTRYKGGIVSVVWVRPCP
ncbi:MAG: hypothetical protein QOD46_1045, partial [Actinomycetota bacterium]|nr:hypothetical protein [Actinomycetota bacterium]